MPAQAHGGIMARKSQIVFLFSMLLAGSVSASAASAVEIHRLIEDGEIDKAKALLVKDPKLIQSCDPDNDETPLHIAAHRNHVALVKYLLEHAAAVNARAYNKFTPLHLAKDPDVVKLLIEHKADLEARDSFDCTALQDAAYTAGRYNDEPDLPARKIVRLLLDAGANYDIRSATCLADVDRVRILLRRDPKEARNKELMRIAAMLGHATIVKVLLEHKADLEDANYGGLPVLYFALEHPDVVRLLLEAGADPKVRLKYNGNGQGPPEEMKWTLLHCAAGQGRIETAQLLLAAGVPVDVRTADDATPLVWAARAGSPEMVRFLLKNKATVEGKDGRLAMSATAEGIRPAEKKEQQDKNARYQAVIAILQDQNVPTDLFTAIALGNAERVKVLLKVKPALAGSKDQDDRDGQPALQRAVDLDHKEIVALLLDAGAPINDKDGYGHTALHWAAFWGREGIAKLLIGRKADVNATSDNGLTPLHESARLNTPAVARLLLDAGAQVNAKDKDGRTPLSLGGGPELVKLLQDRGGKK
jgi:ankyrin repeat protein